MARQEVRVASGHRQACPSHGLLPDVDLRLVAQGDHLPSSLDDYHALVVMGGPMSAISDEGFPTRAREINLLQAALDRDVPTLGVCLGAQLLVLAAGGKVYGGSAGPEVGWREISLTPEAATDALLSGLPRLVTVLHWHSDTFDLPPGSVRLASSALYPNQAFRVGPRAWGVQFHIEVDVTAVQAFVGAFADEAEAVGTAPSEIALQARARVDQLAPVREVALDRFAALI